MDRLCQKGNRMKKIKLNPIELTCILLLAACFMFLCFQQRQITELKQTKEYYECLEKQINQKTAQMEVVNQKYDEISPFIRDWQSYNREIIMKAREWKKR